MNADMQKKHDEKEKRIQDAIALKEPDRVPMNPPPELYPIFHAGYTVAEVVNDASLEKVRNATIQYHKDFDPDAASGVGVVYAGEGPALELINPKNMRWAGMPGNKIDENSLQQFIEYPLLLDDEFEAFFSDRTGWALKKAMPRLNTIYEPLADFQYNLTHTARGVRPLASVFSTPAFRAMIRDMWAIDDFYRAYQTKSVEIDRALQEMGYPLIRGAGATVPFDFYSDYLRGTLLTMTDLYDRPEDIQRYIDETLEVYLDMIGQMKGKIEGKHVFMPLHKGMDGFLSDEHYRKYYWSHLQKIILAIIDSGNVPYIYTEGRYNTRIDCLTEVPPGKVFYHFEDVDMAVAKKKLGGIACISGGFPAILLDWGTPAQVREKVKETLDICAPGGGFIFATSCGIGHSKRENVEAMFAAVREYGKY